MINLQSERSTFKHTRFYGLQKKGRAGFPACLLFLLGLLIVQAQAASEGETLLYLLPDVSGPSGYRLEADPQSAADQELYLLINGGAELYMQAGFMRAIFASYVNDAGKIINLEIFEMASQKSAAQIQAQKIGTQGRTVLIGDAARLENHYLNFRKERFQISVSGADAAPSTQEALLEIGRIVADRIDP